MRKKNVIIKLKLVLAQAISSFLFPFSCSKKENASFHASHCSLPGLTRAVQITRR